jgi:hypothetical protein
VRRHHEGRRQAGGDFGVGKWPFCCLDQLADIIRRRFNFYFILQTCPIGRYQDGVLGTTGNSIAEQPMTRRRHIYHTLGESERIGVVRIEMHVSNDKMQTFYLLQLGCIVMPLQVKKGLANRKVGHPISYFVAPAQR